MTWRRDAVENARGVLRNRRFWQFLAMAVFTLNLKQIFRHMDATFPKYAVRAFGCDAPFGSIYAINPAMIILGVPLVGLRNVRHFDMIFRGGWITADAFLSRGVGDGGARSYCPEPRGDGVVPAMVRLHHGVRSAGKEGIFGALALAPVFAGQVTDGSLGGYLLQTHCPADAGGDCPHSGRGATVGGEVGGEVGGGSGARLGRDATVGRCGKQRPVTLTSPVS